MKIKNRVKKHQEFQKVIHEGKLLKSETIHLYYIANQLGYVRVGISVPTKSGCAVIRNRIRRQIRAVLSKELDLNISYDLIFISRRNYDIDNKKKILSDITILLNQIGK